MILSIDRHRAENRRRNAFTLLEVLVVVAILVVLASVSSVYVFRYLEDAKVDKAKLQAKTLEKAARSYILRNGGSTDGLSLQALIAPPDGGKPFIEGGPDVLNTPFGGQYSLDLDTQYVSFKGPDGKIYSSGQLK